MRPALIHLHYPAPSLEAALMPRRAFPWQAPVPGRFLFAQAASRQAGDPTVSAGRGEVGTRAPLAAQLEECSSEVRRSGAIAISTAVIS